MLEAPVTPASFPWRSLQYLYDCTNLLPGRVNSCHIHIVTQEANFRDFLLALVIVQPQVGGLQTIQRHLKAACALFSTRSADDNVVQVGAGTGNSRGRHVHESLDHSRGGEHTERKASDLVQVLQSVDGQHSRGFRGHRMLLVRLGQVQGT